MAFSTVINSRGLSVNHQQCDAGSKILWVDDSSSNLWVAEELETMGLLITRASSAKAALDMVTHEVFAAILTDIVLPHGDFDKEEARYGLRTGVIMAAQLRERGFTGPIVAYSDILKFSPDDAPYFNALIRKSEILPSELASIVAELIKRCSSEHANGRSSSDA